MDDHGTKRRKNIAENFSRLSRAHERYRRQTTDDRQTDGRQQISNVNVSSRSLKKLALANCEIARREHVTVDRRKIVSFGRK